MSGMGVYPADAVPDVPCGRCLQTADVGWCEVTMLSDPRTYVAPGMMTCRTPGCVDADGSRQTSAPPTPQELADRGTAAIERMLRDLSG